MGEPAPRHSSQNQSENLQDSPPLSPILGFEYNPNTDNYNHVSVNQTPSYYSQSSLTGLRSFDVPADPSIYQLTFCTPVT